MKTSEIKSALSRYISEILSILAILISLFSIYYASISHQFSKRSFTVSIYDQYQKESLNRFEKKYYDRFDFDVDFFKKHKENLNRLFGTLDIQFDEHRNVTISNLDKETRKLFDDLSEDYSLAVKSFNMENNKEIDRLFEYVNFWNKLGTLLENNTLEQDLTRRLFKDEFESYYNFKFIPCIFNFGNFFTNQYYLYFTEEEHIGRFSDEFQTKGALIRSKAPKKFIKFDKVIQNMWFINNGGILFLANTWIE